MSKIVLAVSVFALALSGCGESSKQEESPSEEVAAPQNTSDVDQSNQQAPDPQAVANDSADSEISDEDRELLAQYGTCGSIEKALIHLANGQPNADPNMITMLVQAKAHQATIYTILNMEIIQNYNGQTKDQAIEISNRFLKNEIMGRSLTGSDLVKMEKQHCPQFPADEAGRIMREYKSDYDRMYENSKNI